VAPRGTGGSEERGGSTHPVEARPFTCITTRTAGGAGVGTSRGRPKWCRLRERPGREPRRRRAAS